MTGFVSINTQLTVKKNPRNIQANSMFLGTRCQLRF